MRRDIKRFWVLLGILIAISCAVGGLWFVQYGHRPVAPQVRALWVTRFDYHSSEDVRRIISNVADAGFTDVFFQIRGNGTVFYRSRIEPWAFELSGGDVRQLGTDPGWDPLQLAIDTARGRGLRVHAYMNVLPGWKGMEDPPATAGQLWSAHPDWFMVDSLGQKMLPTSGWYAFLNPVRPEVREHLLGIVKELCDYDVAGIHLDYIRYPHDYHLVASQRYPNATDDELMRHADFSYDPYSMALMERQYGPDITSEQIHQFRRDSVSRVVAEAFDVIHAIRPDGCLLSASVMGNPVEGRYRAYQDSGAWIRQGLVDWAVQMNYGTKSFSRYLKDIRRAGGRRGFRRSVVVGINCKNDVDEILSQMEMVEDSECRGIAFFSYSFLFDKKHEPTQKGRILIPKIRPVSSESE